ncbi:MAG: PHB depolymerase family esterase [Verrucomicrobiales bacterium]|nr:PHB depolymerase family esterase [Verrucomicrobiales bacterium]
MACLFQAEAALPNYIRTINGTNYTFIDYSYYAQADTSQPFNSLGRLYVPENYNSNQSYPLVVFLHGSGEYGTDDHKQVDVHINNLILNARARGFLLLAPQTPYNYYFSDDQQNVIIDLIARAVDQYHADPTRLYATGLSMGGGTLKSLLGQYPQIFAAFVPLSPNAIFKTYYNDTWSAVGKPHWYFHGRMDATVNCDYSDTSVASIVQTSGGTPPTFPTGTNAEELYDFGPGIVRYTQYANFGHDDRVWDNGAYSKAAMYDWMLSQTTALHPLEIGRSLAVNFTTALVSDQRMNTVQSDYYTGATWNTIGRNGTFHTQDIALGFAQDIAGAVTTTRFYVSQAFGNTGTNMLPDTYPFADYVTPEGYWVTKANQSGSITIAGLDPLATYDLQVFASIAATNYQGTYIIGFQTNFLDASSNLDNFVEFHSLATDNSGSLTLTVTPSGGSTYAVINCINVIPISVLTPLEVWRRTYFGTTLNTGNAADTADPDGDGYDNGQEFIAGTNPTDSASRFQVSAGQPDGSTPPQFLINWVALPGRVYDVYSGISLPPTNLTATVAYPTNSWPTAVQAGQSQYFYRIGVRME